MSIVDFFIFLLGLVIGSFLNVVIYRYNTGKSVGGRSQCLSCGKVLRWYELVPMFSFLIQGGRCRGCGSRLAWQYPLVELITGVLFLAVWSLPLPFGLRVINLLIWSILVVIFVYDLRHLIIPNGLVYGFIALAFLQAALLSRSNFDILLSYFLTGLGLAAFFWLLWLVSRGRWLGFADGKLALGLGFLAGPAAGVSAVVLAFWVGAVIGLLLITLSKLSVTRRYFTIKSELPFAPFLIIGLALVTFFHVQAFSFFF